MTNKSTKKALLLSVLSMLICVAMLVGTTFAWFTDSVTSGRNTIKAGNLDVVLKYWDKTANDFVEVNNTTKLFNDDALWEPGHTEIAYLEVSNAGTLALKYQLGVNVVSEVAGTNVAGEKFNLSDYLVFEAVEIEKEAVGTYTREGAWEAAGDEMGLADYKSGIKYLEKQGDKEYVAVIIYMPTVVGNEANYKTGTTAPSITMGVELVATQMVSEKDFFGNDYDDLADFIPAWDGEASDEVPAVQDGVITINTAAQLAAFAADVNGGNDYVGKKVVLGASINLGNKAWTPIGGFRGTFDGQGNTIYNLNTEADQFAGLFGNAYGTIRNVNVDGATVKGGHWVGVIAGYNYGSITNCVVDNATVIGVVINDDLNGDKVGGIVGQIMESAKPGYSVSNNVVKNTTISAGRDVGGIAGAVARANEAVLNNNTVENVSITYSIEKSYEEAGAIISQRLAVEVPDTNKAINVNIYKGTMVAPGVIEVGTKSHEIISKEGLLNMNKVIAETATGEGNSIKFKLLTDVDLAGETWKPIDKMWVEFDGNGKTISNLKTEAWKAGFFGYLGGGYIKNLTLENVDVTGAQAGAFAGSIEGTIDNCVLKGDNTITWAEKHQFDDPTAVIETHSGIGAITGVNATSTINAEIAEGATVTLNYGAIKTQADYIDGLTGYLTANKGTVTNNGKIIKKTSAVVDDAADLAAAIGNGDKVDIELAAGEYKMPSFNSSNEVIISGTKDSVVDLTMGAYMENAKVSFEGVTIKGSTGMANGNGSDYAALYTPNVTYTDCTFDGPFRIGRDGATFIGCTFTNLGNDYVWTYGNDCTFIGCTFESDGKALLIYNDGGNEVAKVTVENCVFNATNSAKAGAIANQNCAAIEIDNTGHGVDLTTSGNTYSEHFSGEWRIKSHNGTANDVFVNGTEYKTIAIDGKTMTIDANRNVTVNE